jgi:hypothetical protein
MKHIDSKEVIDNFQEFLDECRTAGKCPYHPKSVQWIIDMLESSHSELFLSAQDQLERLKQIKIILNGIENCKYGDEVFNLTKSIVDQYNQKFIITSIEDVKDNDGNNIGTCFNLGLTEIDE